MALTPGTRLGPYEITAQIGVGGMGEVWCATDTNLGRQVAIKILPDAFAQDPDRLARFDREAKTLAALNHPNIAIIHGLEKADGIRALVMELVEGPTLADRIGQGPIPIDEALPIVKQIAEALEAAHEQGIIHRDLKPANIKVRSDGTVKVLDFGLAKAMEPVGAMSPSASMSPTITTPAMTQMGIILGTAAYMSPEQAKGRPADKRSDIWAFGCVLYEMLAGRRAFGGEDVVETLAFVITKEQEWGALPVSTPPSVRRLLRRCLEKNRRNRLADIADAKLELDEATKPSEATHLPATPDPNAVPRRYRFVAGMGALLLALLGVLIGWRPWKSATTPVLLRVSAELGADVSLVNQGSAIVLSPDGSLLAFVAPVSNGSARHLYVRRLEELQATPLPGTVDARNPFFSPDGRWIAFFADGKLKKIATTGGAAVTLSDAPDDRGGAWAEDGTIFFEATSRDAPLLRVSSAGGESKAATTLEDGEMTQRWPQVLPGDRAVLYTSHSAAGNFDDANIVVQPLPSGDRKIIRRRGYFGRYVPSGHLLYINEGTLFAAPFSLERLEIVGDAVPVVEDVASGPSGVGANGAAQFAASNTGIFLYLPGGASVGRPMEWIHRSGHVELLRKSEAIWGSPRFAPDGERVAIQINAGAHSDVWVYEWLRDRLTRLTTDPGEAIRPIWTPNGRRIVYSSRRGEQLIPNLYWRLSDGSSDERRLTEGPNPQFPGSWHPSGKLLAFTERNPKTGGDLMLLPIEGDETTGWRPGTPAVFLSTPALEQEPAFSPDGRWLAYTSTESGRPEIFVRSFPGPGGKWQVSTTGGSSPTWSPAKRELLYQGVDERIWVVSYSAIVDSFIAEKPRLWSEEPLFATQNARNFDLHPDGERIVGVTAQESTAKQDKIVFLLDFFEQLRRLVPTN